MINRGSNADVLLQHDYTLTKCTDINDWTALHLAVKMSDAKLIKMLVSVNPNCKFLVDKHGRRPGDLVKYRYRHKDEVKEGDIVVTLISGSFGEDVYKALQVDQAPSMGKYPDTVQLIEAVRNNTQMDR